MNSLLISVFLFSLLAASSPLQTTPVTLTSRTLALPIARNPIRDPIEHDQRRLGKRSKTVEEGLSNSVMLYYANLTVGTPAKKFSLQIDTGSSDMWVNIKSSNLCSAFYKNYCKGGLYYPPDSSTYKLVVENGFNLTYTDGTGAQGDYVTDVITFGAQTFQNFQFGTGLNSDNAHGVLGIGYTASEMAVIRGGTEYSNLPKAMVNAGLINSNAYSLWLNDLQASTGTILFGGVNTAKYEGDLTTLPLIKANGKYAEFYVALTGISISGYNITDASSLPAAALLDSGTSLTYLPPSITETIYKSVSAIYDSSSGYAYADCKLADQNATIDFTFSGKTISVSMNELMFATDYEAYGADGAFTDGSDACMFGIIPSDDNFAILGDTFLRSAYVVYDLDNNQISLAQTVFNSTTDDIQEITTGSNAVPGATMVADPITAVVGKVGNRIGSYSGASVAQPWAAFTETPFLGVLLVLTLAYGTMS